jgi:flagellar biogenesis protein FliO
VKVYQILFVLWFIVFIFWLFRQFAEHNKRKGK